MSESAEQKIEAAVVAWVSEAIELRHGTGDDEEGKLKIVTMEDGVQAVMHELTRVRKRTDRVDYIRTQVAILRSKLKKARAEAKFVADSKLAETTTHRNRVKLDYDSAAAVSAEAGLDAFEERRAAHEAQVLFEVVEDSYRILDKITSELDSIRTDLRAIIKSLQFSSTLEH